MDYIVLKLISISLLCFPTTQKSFEGFECTIDDTQSPPFGERKAHVRVKHEDSGPLRVKILKAYGMEIRQDSNEILDTIVMPAIKNWTRHLKPKHPLRSPLRVKQQCVDNNILIGIDPDGSKQEYCENGCKLNTLCQNTKIPPNYLAPCRLIYNGQPVIRQSTGNGVQDADYLLIVDTGDTEQCDSGLHAYAGICEIDPIHNRPLVGLIHLCPHLLYTLDDDVLFKINVATHELGHAFGMVKGMYAFMLNEDGEPLTKRDPLTGRPNNGFLNGQMYKPSEKVLTVGEQTYRSAKGVFKRPVYRLMTPKLVAAARKHFRCASLQYVELENQGSPLTTGTHLEKRHYNGELMVGSTGPRLLLTNITLAFFEDSGWYYVDYTGSANLTWGYRTGCDFTKYSCYEYKDWYAKSNRTPFPWCFEVTSKCEVMRYPNALDGIYQYFAQSPGLKPVDLMFYGGPDELMDYCPYHVDAQ